jgi:hypothetical protein
MATYSVGLQNWRSGSRAHLPVENAVFDGEIACRDGDGRMFRDLLARFRFVQTISSPLKKEGSLATPICQAAH